MPGTCPLCYFYCVYSPPDIQLNDCILFDLMVSFEQHYPLRQGEWLPVTNQLFISSSAQETIILIHNAFTVCIISAEHAHLCPAVVSSMTKLEDVSTRNPCLLSIMDRVMVDCTRFVRLAVQEIMN